MKKEKFVINLAIALTLVIIAAALGEVRRITNERVVNETRKKRTSCFDKRESLSRAHSFDDAEVLVRFRSDVSDDVIRRVTGHLNDSVQDRYEAIEGLTAISDADGFDAETVAAEYRALSDIVEYAEPSYQIRLEPMIKRSSEAGVTKLVLWQNMPSSTNPITSSTTPNDPMFTDQWGLSNTGQRDGRAGGDISALKAWERTRGSRDVVVAVLDSGVDYNHPDLAENIWTRPANVAMYSDEHLGTIDDMYGYNAADNTGDPMDENGHGTHCAGIIGAVGGNNLGITGVNWQVKIMPLKFMSRGGFGTTKNAIEAINYVIERKKAGVPVSIISASWGSTQRSKALENAIRRAGEAGILFIAASGNASTNTDRSPHYPANYNLPNVMSVAALTRKDELARFSNYGAKTVHIAAPGAEILSTWLGGEFEEASGTSMATPNVAGVAALVLAENPEMSVGDLRQRLMDTVDKLDALTDKTVSGGRLNAARAVAGK